MYSQISDRSRTVEVLVSLAFGGAVLSVVFMAIPNLRGSSDDRQRDLDVVNIGRALTGYVTNNGQLPDAWDDNYLNNTFLLYYMPQDIVYETDLSTNQSLIASTGTGFTPETEPNQLKVTIYKSAECSGEDGSVTASGTRNFAIVYYRESDQGYRCLSY